MTVSGDRAQNGVSTLERLPAEAGSKETQGPARRGVSYFLQSRNGSPGSCCSWYVTCARRGLALLLLEGPGAEQLREKSAFRFVPELSSLQTARFLR